MIFRSTYQRITIINTRKPTELNIHQKLQWLANSLGLFNLRDKENSCFRLFIELLKASKKNESLSSDELALRLNLSRGTIVHHLKKLIEAGIVISDQNKYYLRVDNLKDLVTEIEKDITRTLDDLKKTAAEIDNQIGL
jgi:predicted transcriptional regulator